MKIHDFERLEPPHVTIYQKMQVWRLSLRDKTFLLRTDKWSDLHADIRGELERNWDLLVAEWNALHPENPVFGQDDEDDHA